MSESIWLPPFLVLVLGIIAAWWITRKVRASRPATPAEKVPSDLRLRLADLEAKRDDLYRRLASADEEGLDAEARAELERSAAVTLRNLEHAKRKAGAQSARKAPAEKPVAGRRSAVAGFVAGVVATALIGMLVYWAVRDAKPDPQRIAMARQAGEPIADEPHAEEELPPFVASQVAQLEAALEADPENTDARKQLALILLQVERYVPAFQQASEVLQRVPGDPDALFIHGVVRLAMGQNAEAVSLLDEVLGRFPQHVYASLYKGLAQARQGDRAGAIATWREAIERNGDHPEIQRLLDMAEGSLGDGTLVADGSSQQDATPAPTPAAAGGSELRWQAPDGWDAEEPSSPMRRAQYRVPGPAGDGELVVFYFGPGQGGDAMANAERWAGQFTQPDGRPSTEAMTTSTRTVGSISVLEVEVGGTYTGGMSGAGETPDALLLGAIAEGPDANWFFKLTGPRATIEAQRAAFDELVASFQVED